MLNACVEIFLVFSDNDQIHVRMSRGDVGRIHVARADISEEAQGLTNGHVEWFVTAADRSRDRTLQKD